MMMILIKNIKVSRVFTIHIRWVKYNLGGYKKQLVLRLVGFVHHDLKVQADCLLAVAFPSNIYSRAVLIETDLPLQILN